MINHKSYKITNNDFFMVKEDGSLVAGETNVFETKEFPLAPDTINNEKYTIDAILVTEGKAQMFDRRLWETVDEIQLMSGAELPIKVVLLDTHKRFDTSYVLGSIIELKVVGKELHGTVVFVQNDLEVEKIWNKVKQGHLDSLSIGFKVLEAIYIQPGTKQEVNGTIYEASKNRYLRIDKKWVANEGSIVPIGADPDARFKMDTGSRVGTEAQNGKAHEMDESVNPKGAGNAPMIPGQNSGTTVVEPVKTIQEPAPTGITAAQEEAILKKHETRIEHLTSLAGSKVPPEVLKAAIDSRMDDEQAGLLFYKHIAADRPPPVDCEVGKDLEEGHTKMLADAVLYKCAAGKNLLSAERKKEVSRYSSMGLKAMTRLVLQKKGEEVPYDDNTLYEKAVSSMDLNEALGDAMNRGLAVNYLTEPSTLEKWTRQREVKDFRTIHDVKLGTMDGVGLAHKGQPINFATLSDTKETYRLETGALGFGVDRMTFINDDLGVLVRAMEELAYGLKMDLENKGYNLLLKNAGQGPAMKEDGKKLFSLTHAQPNLIEGTPESVFSQTGLDNANEAFSKIRRFQGKAASNQKADFLLVPARLHAKAQRITDSTEIRPAEGGETGNIYKGRYQVEGEARLDVLSSTAWYEINTKIETIIRIFLNNQLEPTFRSVDVTTHLGLSWQIWFDYAVGLIDWRGILRATGIAAA